MNPKNQVYTYYVVMSLFLWIMWVFCLQTVERVYLKQDGGLFDEEQQSQDLGWLETEARTGSLFLWDVSIRWLAFYLAFFANENQIPQGVELFSWGWIRFSCLDQSLGAEGWLTMICKVRGKRKDKTLFNNYSWPRVNFIKKDRYEEVFVLGCC